MNIVIMSHISFVFLASARLSYALAFGSEAVRSTQVVEPSGRATSVFSQILASSSVLSGGSQTTDTYCNSIHPWTITGVSRSPAFCTGRLPIYLSASDSATG